MADPLSSRKRLLLTQVGHYLRLKHYSIRMEDAYVLVVKRFILQACFAAHFLYGYDVCTIQELQGHQDILIA